ncbi:MAG: hypothetical protein WBC06_01845 [Chitinophagaceae bacterium]
MKKKLFLSSICSLMVLIATAQNVGIGTTTPHAPLQFGNTLNNRKIVLWEAADDDHQFYGLGIGNSALQYQTASVNNDHIFYAAASNTASTELLRIKGNGNVGIGNDPVYRLDVNGRMRIRSSGSNAGSAGIWLNNNANDASPAFVGMESDNIVGFYGAGSPNGWGLTMNTVSGNIGIGTSVPGFPLNFPSTVGDKISLYGNSGTHYGFGIQGSLLQIHTSTSGDNIAFGYGSSSSFTERARIINEGEIGMEVTGRLRLRTGTETAGIWLNNSQHAARAFIGLQSDSTVGFFGNNGSGWGLFMNTRTGALSIGGASGQSGQVLTNNGNSASASWASPTHELYNNTVKIQGATDVYINQGFTFIDVPGLSWTFTVASNSKVIIHHNVYSNSSVCSGCSGIGNRIDLQLFVNGNGLGIHKYLLPYGDQMTISGVSITTLSAGTYTVNVKARASGALGVWFGTSFSDYANNIILQVIPQ